MRSSFRARTATATTTPCGQRGRDWSKWGWPSALRDPQPWEIEAAINGQTVAVAFSVGFSPLDLGEVVDVAHRHRLPVIVDASAALPPKAHLQSFIAAGADLVAFSGGKGIRGPQASGILCGRKDLIASAALQMWDLDFLPELWNPPDALIDPCPAALQACRIMAWAAR